MTRKKRRPQQKAGAAATANSAENAASPGSTADKAAQSGAKRDDRAAKPAQRPPWSRTGIALALSGAMVIAIGFQSVIAAAGGYRGIDLVALAFNVGAGLAGFPVIAAGFVLLETPVRILHHERRMKIAEALGTGIALAFLVANVAGLVAGLNQPSTSSTSGSSSSPTPAVSASPHPSSSATPAAHPSPSATPAARPPATATPAANPSAGSTPAPAASATPPGSASATAQPSASPARSASPAPTHRATASTAPTPVGGTARPATPAQSTTDIAVGWVVGDILAVLASVLLYPPAFRFFVTPRQSTPRKDAPKGKQASAKGSSTKR